MRRRQLVSWWACVGAAGAACAAPTAARNAGAPSAAMEDAPAPPPAAEAPERYWDTPRRGANYFARPMDDEWLDAAREAGIEWVRLAPAFWPTAERDFLLGDADEYHGLQAQDLAMLREQLDLAEAHGMKVVWSMLSLPGARWRQHNGDEDDPRLWQDTAFREQAVRFWQDLVAEIGEHPALVGVNVLNEPRPLEPAQLDGFYRDVVNAIREIAPTLPILLDPGPDAEPRALAALAAIADPDVLYDVHLYEPWEFVTWRTNQGRFSYPGPDEQGRTIDRAYLASVLARDVEWQSANGVPASRIVLGEFGIDRRIGGAAEWLGDVIELAEENGWHWAFYAFRDWQAMDYELGAEPPPAAYWAAEERGEPYELPRPANPMFDAIRAGLARSRR